MNTAKNTAQFVAEDEKTNTNGLKDSNINPKIAGIETNGLTVGEFVELQKEKGEFEQTAEGFKMNITQAKTENEPTAQEIINGLNPVSYSKIKKAVSVKATRGEVERGEYRDLKTGRVL